MDLKQIPLYKAVYVWKQRKGIKNEKRKNK